MKTTLHSLFIGLAFIAGIHQVTAQVTNLGIAPVVGGQSLLYWPASPTNSNYILQSTTNLASSNWTTEQYPVPVTASTVSNTTPARFFRLVYTNPPVGMVLIPAGSFTMGNQFVNPSNNTPTNDPDITDALPTNVVCLGVFHGRESGGPEHLAGGLYLRHFLRRV